MLSCRDGMGSKRIVLTTFGSLGDLHPYLALAIGLQGRGHRVTIATSGLYQSKVEAGEIVFHAVRPYIAPDDTAAIRKAMDAKNGSEYVLRQMLLPHLRDS